MKHWKEFSLGLFILTAALLLAYMSITIGKVQFGDTLHVEAVFDNASGIVKDAPVMLAGIEVGHVESLQVTGQDALMTLTVNPEVKLYADARAEIRSKSLLGEKYIALKPGSSSTALLQDGQRINDTMTPVDLDEVLNHLAPVLTQIDPDDLNTLIHSLAVTLKGREKAIGELIEGGATLMRVLGRNEASIERMVRNLDAVSANANVLLANNGPTLNRLIRNLDAVALQLRQDAPELMASLRGVGSDVREITEPFRRNAPELARRLDQISADAEQLTRSLSAHPDLVPNLNATLTELPPLLQKTPATLDRLPGVLDQLSPVLMQLPPTLTKVDDTLGRLNPVLDKANNLLDEEKIRDLLQKEGLKVHVDQLRLW
ncbi:MAG: MlaD family protein [Candidatus Sericytochromatia bacterium]